MAHASTFLVLTLLQLCRAEIPKPLPEWYAANLINDANYSPKPLTEIFSTDPSFTSKNDASQSTSQYTSTSTPWPSPSSSSPTTKNINQGIDNSRNSWSMDTTQLIPKPSPPIMSQIGQTNKPQGQSTQGPQGSQGNQGPQQGPQGNQEQQQGPNVNWVTQTQPPSMPNPTQGTPKYTQPTPQTRIPYQSSTPSFQGSQFGIWNSNQPNGLQGNQISNGPSFQPYFPMSIAQSETPIILPSKNINSPCNTGPFPTSTQWTNMANIRKKPNNETKTGPSNKNPILTISVKRGKGSKTNVLINPSTSPTTSQPSTTKRPSTRKNKNYEACLDTCKDRKDPICGSPKGVTPVNPDTLKGFGSLCHLACHNSYRNQQYDKVADGRCGKLRTRIRPMDQDKLNKDELNKAQYNIVHNAGETLIEFAELISPAI